MKRGYPTPKSGKAIARVRRRIRHRARLYRLQRRLATLSMTAEAKS
jgi:hypothetical protein